MLSRRKRRSPSKSVGSIPSSEDPASEPSFSSPDTATLSSFSNRSSMLLASFEQHNPLEILHEDDEAGKRHASPELTALSAAYTRFVSKSGAMKTNVIRVRLLPFLRTNLSASGPSQPAALSARLHVFQQWWTRLLDDVTSASSAERGAYYEAVSFLMARPEWLSAPLEYEKLLESTVAHAVERVAVGSAVSLAMGAFLGKVLAYGFFYCPGIAEPLLYLLRVKQSSLDRLAHASLPPSSDPSISSLKSAFPLHCQPLVGHAVAINKKPIAAVPELYGAWSRRWDASTEVFASFFKHYYSLLSVLSLPESENWLHAHLAAPGIFHLQAAILDFLEAQIAPAVPSQSANNVMPDISAPYPVIDGVPNRSPSVSRRISRVDRLRILTSIREILHNDNECLPFWKPYAIQFDRIFQLIAKSICVYNMNACVSLCDLVEEWIASLTLYHPRSVRQQTHHLHEAVDWLFWIHVCQRMITSENCHTEIRSLALLFNIWGHLPGRETSAVPLLPYIPMPYDYDLSKMSHFSSDSSVSTTLTTNASSSTLTSHYSSSESLQQLSKTGTSLSSPKFTSEMYDALAAANADSTRQKCDPAVLASMLPGRSGTMKLEVAPNPPPHSRVLNRLQNKLPPHHGPMSLLFCPHSSSLLGDVTLWILSEPVWERYFCHWNPLVRSYYHRLLVFRIVSAGPSSDFIAQTDWASYHSAARSLLAIRLKDTYNQCFNSASRAPQNHDPSPMSPVPGRLIQIVYSGANQNGSAEDGHHRAYPFDIFDNVAYYGNGGQGSQSRQNSRSSSYSSMASMHETFLNDKQEVEVEPSSEEKKETKTRRWQVFRRRKSEKETAKEDSVSPLDVPAPPQLLERRPIIQRSPYRFVLAHSARRSSSGSNSSAKRKLTLPRLPFESEPLRSLPQQRGMSKASELLYYNYGSRSLAEWNQTVRMFEDFANRQIHLSSCLEDMVIPFLVAEIPS